MDYSIAIVEPNVNIANTCKRVIYSMGLDYPVYCKTMVDALETTKELINKGTKIVLSMGMTAQYLKIHANVLVLELQYSPLEFMKAINEGFKYSDKIAVVGSESLTYAMKKAIESSDRTVNFFELTFDEPIEKQALRVIEQGYDVIISGLPSTAVANELGKKGISPDIDEKSVKAAVENAQYILRLLNESKEKFETMQAILDCTSEGIIGTDKSNHITFINPAAEKLIGIEKNKIFQKTIDEVLKENKVVNILNNDFKNRDGEKYLIINNVPIVVDGIVTGTVSAVKEISEIRKLEQRIRKELILKGHYAKNNFDDIIGNSRVMKKTKDIAKKYSKFDSTVLIFGETGTGKELFAQSIHNESNRKNEAFVAVNCAALPENLLESELFGYVKGAFTGARQEGKEGLFEMAHNGTIFLDEISEIPLNMQARLLRVLQENEIVKIGDDKVIPIDVRILSASNKNLLDLVKEGKFREDLYYRLCVLELKIPPLRSRAGDIKEISENIVMKKNKKLNKNIKGLTPQFIESLEKMEWSGNVRQLSNFIERMMVLCEDEYLDICILDHYHEEKIIFKEDNDISNEHKENTIEDMEIKMIYEALIKTDGNKKEAATLLGINPSTLWRKLKQQHESSNEIKS